MKRVLEEIAERRYICTLVLERARNEGIRRVQMGRLEELDTIERIVKVEMEEAK